MAEDLKYLYIDITHKLKINLALFYNTEAVSLLLQLHFWAFGDVEMKLDEKIISYFESCNSPVDKEGFLYKKVR